MNGGDDLNYWLISLRAIGDGLSITITATLGGMFLALILGLLASSARQSHHAWLARPVGLAVEFLRSTPLLIQLFFVHYGLPPLIGVSFTPMTTGVLTLGLHYGAYCSEIFRAAFTAVPHGQREAAIACGLSPLQRFVHVSFPQAITRALPDLGNRWIAMFKDTPMLLAVNLVEAYSRTKTVVSDTGAYIEPYTTLGIVFLTISITAGLVVRLLERLLPVRHA